MKMQFHKQDWEPPHGPDYIRIAQRLLLDDHEYDDVQLIEDPNELEEAAEYWAEELVLDEEELLEALKIVRGHTVQVL